MLSKKKQKTKQIPKDDNYDNNYHGITYPDFIDNWDSDSINFWKNNFCSKGYHLFDEVKSDTDHYLHCDICELEVHISKIGFFKSKNEKVTR